MLTGLTQLRLKDTSLVNNIRRAKELGYQAVELEFFTDSLPSISADASELKDLRQQCEKEGMHVPSLVSSPPRNGSSLLSPDQANRRQAAELIERNLRLAQALGVDGILVSTGKLQSDDSYARAWNDCIETLKGITDEARKMKCWIGIEPTLSKFMLTPREARDLIQAIGSEWVGIYLDTGNVQTYGFPEMWLRDLGSCIRKIHLSDYCCSSSRFVPLLEGDCNWPEIMAACRANGFDGSLVSEVGGDENTLREMAHRVRQIMAL